MMTDRNLAGSATAAIRPNPWTRVQALNPISQHTVPSVATQSDERVLPVGMPPDHEPVLGHGGSVQRAPLANAFGQGLTSCGHTDDECCGRCAGRSM